ncbi:MAG: hypothetical protein E6I57_05695 [Chloroflexi bacterium]|nr:MAG: hypothetical protein E6I57_05695 [Chloroflexota bacterium]
MRSLVLACAAALILWSVPASSADAATAPFDSEYFGESAFLNVVPGQSYEFTVFFGNTGSTPWVRNTSTQVNLAICREDKVTCNVFSPWASWNDGWLSTIAYATHVQDTVAPGTVATFKYPIRPPSTAACQIHHFNGDLVLAATLSPLHPQGYFQDATISC